MPEDAGLPVPADEIDAELSRLADLRQTNRRAYWSGETQSRELALLEERERNERHERVEQLAEASGLERGLLAEWEATEGLDHHLGVAQGAAERVLVSIPEDTFDEFADSFDALPAGIQTSVFRELGSVAPDGVQDATEDQLQNFIINSADEGRAAMRQELLKTWGQNAARNLAAVDARFGRVFDGLSDEDTQVALNWFNQLTAEEEYVVLTVLAEA